MNEKNLISVIIPSYNRAHLIGETIRSIQNQTYPMWECIIIDDGSTDDTENVVLEYVKNDRRISFYKKPKHLKKGASTARNYGFSKSKGQYINWFDSDDLMNPEKLETDLKLIQSGNFDFTISQSTFFSENGTSKKKYWNKNLWSNDPINDFITKKIGWGVNSPLWVKESLERAKVRFDEELMTANDFKFHLQVLQFNLKPAINNQILVKQREHDSRLINYIGRDSNKLRVYLYLIEFNKGLKLNTYTLSYLNWHFVKFYSWLLKNRKIGLATKFLVKCWLLDFTQKTKMEVVKLWFKGWFFYIFRRGYKFLKH